MASLHGYGRRRTLRTRTTGGGTRPGIGGPSSVAVRRWSVVCRPPSVFRRLPSAPHGGADYNDRHPGASSSLVRRATIRSLHLQRRGIPAASRALARSLPWLAKFTF